MILNHEEFERAKAENRKGWAEVEKEIDEWPIFEKDTNGELRAVREENDEPNG